MGLGVVGSGADHRDIAVQVRSTDPAVRQALDRQGDRDARLAIACLEVADLTAALQTYGGGECLKGQAEFFSKRLDVHSRVFAYHEQGRKDDVRNAPADKLWKISHNANMAKKATGPTDYEALRLSSGWYAAAWRDFRGITQQDLADEIGSSRGQISDLETGAKTRFNRDWVEKFGKALNVTGGRLIDVNPFTLNQDADRFDDALKALDEKGRNAVYQLAATLSGRTGTEG